MSTATKVKPQKVKPQKVKLYMYCNSAGAASAHFFSDDLKYFWNGKELATSYWFKPDWIKTNCFIEVEIFD